MAAEKSSLPLEQTGIAPTTPSVDWQSGKTLSECLHHVFTSGTVSDVTFLVGEDKKIITAHKLILLSRSPVFYSMLEGPLAEKGEIFIPDIKDTIFRSFLGYLYTDKIDLTINNVVPVLSAAMKYCVDILISVCEDVIIHNLSVDNVCLFLEESHVFHVDKLRADCLQLIYESAPASLQSKPFTALCASCMETVVESDCLNAEESDVYVAITQWAGEQCSRQDLEVTNTNKRKVLGDMLLLARFNTMDLNFLLQRVFIDGILTSDLAVAAVNYQMQGQIESGSRLTCQRRLRKEKQKVLRCSDSSAISPASYGTKESFIFHCSSRAIFHGFGTLVKTEEEITADVQVFEEKELVKVETKLSLVKDAEQVCEITFAKPLLLKAGKRYTVIEQLPAKRRYGFKSSRKTVSFGKGLVTFDMSSNRDTYTYQTITYLILSCLKDYGCNE